MTDFWVENTEKFFWSSKIEVLSLASLDSETFQLGSTELGKSQLELITTNCMYCSLKCSTVKLGNKERFDKELIGNKEPFPVNNLPFTS